MVQLLISSISTICKGGQKSSFSIENIILKCFLLHILVVCITNLMLVENLIKEMLILSTAHCPITPSCNLPVLANLEVFVKPVNCANLISLQIALLMYTGIISRNTSAFGKSSLADSDMTFDSLIYNSYQLKTILSSGGFDCCQACIRNHLFLT